ncbi:MAG: NAD-dependent epimerase/dehydratase family protein, partial [Hyphomicrobium sp.]
MKKVLVLGANGQVGGELCFLLSLETSLMATAVARSENGLALLRNMGVQCAVHPGGDLKELLQNCDVVVDLVHPWENNIASMRRSIVARCQEIHRHLPPHARVVYASTMSVYRLDPDVPAYTIYGYTKLFAEKLHRQLGRKFRHPVYIFRLGQVHGA